MPEPHWTFISLAAMIITAFAIFLTSTCIWKRCCRNQNDTMPTLSAPPMPIQMPAQMPMVVPTRTSRLATVPTNRAQKSNASVPITISFHLKRPQRKTPKKGRDIGNDIL
jgi:hypothetical protein